MSTGICTSNKGFGMIDSVMALFITLIGIAGLLAMMPIGWGLAGTSDMRTRGSEILHRELEEFELVVMNPCNTITPYLGAAIRDKFVYSTGQPGQSAAISGAGDRQFTVKKTLTQAGTGSLITVQVLWDGTSTGIKESRVVTGQEDFQDNTNCGVQHATCDFTINKCW